MCNLYTMKLSRDEVRGLLEHFKLVGKEWAEVFARDQAGMNESGLVYPKYPAPVVIVRDGVETIEKMRWGMPGPVFPPKPGAKPVRPGFITNIRNTASGHWKPWLAASSVIHAAIG
jgi:putative SOS response-associated peptidase YedK